MKLTQLDILRLALDQAFDKRKYYDDLYADSNFTDSTYKLMLDYWTDTFNELYDLIIEQRDALKSL